MHERTERAVARALFVLLCACPTSLTLVAILVSVTPWYGDYQRHRFERELSARIGVGVEIEAIEKPAPGMIRLVGLVLTEPETGLEVGRVRLATWTRADSKTVIRLSQPEVKSERLRDVWRVIHDRFLCQPELTRHAVRVAADDVTIHSRSGSTTLRDFDAWLRPEERRVEATLQCVPAGRRDDAPVHVRVIRDRGGEFATTEWTLLTGGLTLPCSALGEYLPVLDRLGPEATFAGTLRWKVSDAGWSIDLGGSRFDEVELSDLMEDVPHRLTGRASVAFQRGQLDPKKAIDISGTLTAASGYLGWSLVRAASEHLGFEVASPEDPDAKDLAYDRIGLRFDLFGPRLTLAGICHQQRGLEYLSPGVIVTSGGYGVVGSGGEPRSWASLVRTFWQDGRESLPASTQSGWLMSWLPAPKLSAPVSAAPPRITGTGSYRGVGAIRPPQP